MHECGTTQKERRGREISLSPPRLEIKREALTNCLGRMTRRLTLPVGAGLWRRSWPESITTALGVPQVGRLTLRKPGRRRISAPIMPMPSTSIAQVSSSGTPPGSVTVVCEVLMVPKSCPIGKAVR